jgi:hypothetical protein
MDALETLVREAFAEHAHEAPGLSQLTVPEGPARRRWPYALLASAVVAAVAVGIAIAIARGGGSNSAAPAAPSFAPIPPGMNEVSYHGITLLVPDNLPIGSAAMCQQLGVYTLDPHARVVNCANIPVLPPGGTTVKLIPYDLYIEQTGPRPRSTPTFKTLDLPKPGVHVEVSAPNAAEVDAILRSIRVTPVDRNGCAATLPVLDNPPAKELLPGTPSAASECIFTTELRSSHPAFLLRSLPVDPDRLARLVAAIRGLPAGSSGRSAELPGAARYLFTYADGSTRTINVTRGDDATVTDGQHVAHDPDNSIAQAFD